MRRKEENLETWKKFSSGLLTPINNLLDEKLTIVEKEYLEIEEACKKLAECAEEAVSKSKSREVACKHVVHAKRLNRALVKRQSRRVLDADEGDAHVVAVGPDGTKDRTESYKTANEEDISRSRLFTPPTSHDGSVVSPLPKEFPAAKSVAAQAMEKKKLSKWDCLAAGLSVSVLYNKNKGIRHTSANRKAGVLRRSILNVSRSGRTAHPFRPLQSNQSSMAHAKFRVFANKENVARKMSRRTPPKPSTILVAKIEPKSSSTTTPVKRNYIITNNELTPPRPKGQMKSENDYGIDELRSEDSTDDEECPRKTRPPWASQENLLEQVRRMRPYSETFKIFPPVDLSEIFRDHPLPHRVRTSSAIWHSFHRTLLDEQSMFEDAS